MRDWIISVDIPDKPRSGDLNNSIRFFTEGDVSKGVWGWGSDNPPFLGAYKNGWHMTPEKMIHLHIISL